MQSVSLPLVLGTLALLKYPRILTLAAEKSINLSHRNTNQIIILSQGDACDIQDLNTATDQTLPSVQQRDETGFPFENAVANAFLMNLPIPKAKVSWRYETVETTSA
jgi:hypothetical protein